MERDYKAYHKNSQIEYDWPKLNGKYHGIQRAWYENGQLGDIYLNVNGRFIGMRMLWNNDGNRWQIIQYKKDRHGIIIDFKYKPKK